MINLKSFIIIPLVFLGSCSKYEKIISDAKKFKKSHNEKRIIDGELEPPFPSKKENNRTLLGLDVNKNGIRDDIDIWINYVGRDSNHRMALRQLAREEVKRMLAGASKNTEAYNQIAKDIWDGLLCTSYFELKGYDDNQAPSFLMSNLVYNTDLREKAYERFHESSLVYKSNNENINTENTYLACKFKLEMVVNKNRE